MMQVDGEPPTQEWEGQDPGAAPEPAADSSDAPPPEDNLICQAIDLSRYPTLFGLDLPVVCKDPYKAMPFVGGAEKVTRAYRGETKKIFFRFRPEDRMASMLGSKPLQACSRLLLRYSVRRNKRTGESQVVGVEVAGVVAKCFSFVSLADFVYLTSPNFKQQQTVSKTKLEIVPTSFVFPSDRRDYKYTTLIGQTQTRKPPQSMMCKQVRWGEPIPAECTFVMTKRSRKGKRQHIDKQTLTRMRLEHLFDRHRGGRDIWQRKALDTLVEDMKTVYLEQLRMLAFNMPNGPWQRTWIRFGYNPMTEPLSRLYQILDVRWKETDLEALKKVHEAAQQRRGEAVTELTIFGCLARKQVVFQLVDLQDVSLQREVLAFPRKREPTATGGWFRIKDMDLLRRRVVRYLHDVVHEDAKSPTPLPPKPFWTVKEMLQEADAHAQEDKVLQPDEYDDRPPPPGMLRKGASAGPRKPSKKKKKKGADDDEDEDGEEEREEGEGGEGENEGGQEGQEEEEEEEDEDGRAFFSAEDLFTGQEGGAQAGAGGPQEVPLSGPVDLRNVDSLRLLRIGTVESSSSSSEGEEEDEEEEEQAEEEEEGQGEDAMQVEEEA